MTEIRTLFGGSLSAIGGWLAGQAVELAGWYEGPSALADLSVRGLTGHLLRAMTVVENYLDRPFDPGEPGTSVEVVSAAAYYAGVLPADGRLDSDFNRAIRQRGLEAAPDTPGDVARVWSETAARLTERLAAEPAD
ncbi:MAG TPA: hypothetical protein VHL53_01435, partial [Acidimicrobiia bacterium]|nr:hypothetical protein [Acidimicrobiia bacterium]